MSEDFALESSTLQFSLDRDRASWSLFDRRVDGTSLVDARMRVAYRVGGRRFEALRTWPRGETVGPLAISSEHGPQKQITLTFGPDENGLHWTLDFALLMRHPFFLWRVKVENNGHQPIFIDRFDLLNMGSSSQISLGPKPDLAFFSNGWQSWSYCGVYAPGEHIRRTRLGFLHLPIGDNAGASRPSRSGLYPSQMFGVVGDRASRLAMLAGFLSQKEHFGTVEMGAVKKLPVGTANKLPCPYVNLWANGDGARLDPGQRLTTDWACLHFLNLDDPDPLGAYLEAVARQHAIEQEVVRSKIPNGWCSWYQFCDERYIGTVTAQDIRDNLQSIAGLRPDLPLDLVQIDDGFEAKIGDWLAFNPKFAGGVAPLAAEIRLAGLTPGLWLAPFIVHPKARLAAEHPGWLLRGALGRPVNAGYLWGAFATALDLTHPEVQSYVSEVIAAASQEWGFPYLKLDFLYAASLPGKRHDPTRTRAQALRAGLEIIRNAAGEGTFLLGCGCPLGPAIGLMDGMRIGADIARRWNPSFIGIEKLFKGEADFPAARNASHNTLTRAALHRRWWVNDPDCLLLRPTTHLTLAEVHSLATAVALTGGSLLFSDHMPDLPPGRLRIAQALLPLIGERPRLLDWFDATTPHRLRLDLQGAAGAWHLLAFFNWEDVGQVFDIRLKDYDLDPTSSYIAREFWSGESEISWSGGWFNPKSVPPHGVILLAVRRLQPELPLYVGSDLHISQGLEVAGWQADPGRLDLQLQRPGRAQGLVELSLPAAPQLAALDGQALTWQATLPGCYRFQVELDQRAQFHLEW
jgi:alpha-galactosidase